MIGCTTSVAMHKTDSKQLQELDLAKDAIFANRASSAARNRYLYFPDHLVRMPHPAFGLIQNIRSLASEPIFQGAIWAGITELFKNARDPEVQDESIGDFFSRRLGKNMVDRILSGMIHGIYAGDVWQLSAKSLFPTQWRDEVQAESLLQGMMKARADGIEVTKREADYLQTMKTFAWDPLLRATLRETVVFTLKDGLSMLSDALARVLMGSENVEFRMKSPVHMVHSETDDNKMAVWNKNSKNLPETAFYDHVVWTLPPKQLQMLHSMSGGELPSIPTTTVMTVNLYYRTPNLNPPGFGYLIPLATPFENNPERALGVVFDTAYAPSPEDVNMKNWHAEFADGAKSEALQQARDQGRLININDFAWYNIPNPPNLQDNVQQRGTKLTVMLGGHWWDDWPAYPDEQEGLKLAKSLLERHLGITEEPEAWQVNLQKDCIPQYTVGHEQRLKTAHNSLWRHYRGKLRVAGSWISGVGVNDCLRSAWDVVQALKTGKDGTGLEHVGTSEYVRLKPIKPGEKPDEQ